MADEAFRDLGLGKLLADLEGLSEVSITLGWQGESGAAVHPDSDGMDIATIGAIHELGTTDGKIPARPALATAMELYGDELDEAMAEAMSDLVDGRADVPDVVRKLGTAGVLAVRAAMIGARVWAKPLADSTVKGKGHDLPLYKTGELERSVSWAERHGDRIVMQGGEE